MGEKKVSALISKKKFEICSITLEWDQFPCPQAPDRQKEMADFPPKRIQADFGDILPKNRLGCSAGINYPFFKMIFPPNFKLVYDQN